MHSPLLAKEEVGKDSPERNCHLHDDHVVEDHAWLDNGCILKASETWHGGFSFLPDVVCSVVPQYLLNLTLSFIVAS